MNLTEINTGDEVLVIISAKTCVPCNNFKKTFYKDFITEAKNKNLSILQIDLDDMTSLNINKIKQFNPRLEKYLKWYPMIYLFTKDSWDNPETELNGLIFNGILKNNKVEWNYVYGFDSYGLSKWLNDSLNKLE